MRANIIENGKVINTIVVDSLDFMPDLIEAPDNTGIGWSYINGKFVDERPEILIPMPTPEQTKTELIEELRILTVKIQAMQ